MSENTHVAMDTEWCAANPDIACDLIAAQQDRERQLRDDLIEATAMIASLTKALRAAITQPASTQPLTDHGETSTAVEVAPKDGEYKYPGSDWYRDNVGGGAEP